MNGTHYDNPNLPLRYLMYVADIYSVYTKDKNLYGTKKVEIPTPKFVIFYNGVEEQPDIRELRLSDLYTIPENMPSLELKAVMVNINKGKNERLLATCKTLRDYAEYTWRVREYTKEMKLEAAVERAISECIREGILAEFLSKNRAEVKKVSIYEYDYEKHMRHIREEAWEDALDVGREEGRKVAAVMINLLKEMGMSKTDIQQKLMEKLALSEKQVTEFMDLFEE